MNFLNRAIKNITRKPSKSILLAITFFVIGNLVIIGLGISASSENAKTLTRQQMRAVVNYEVDYDAFYRWADSLEDEDARNEAYSNYPRVNRQDAKEIAEDERVVAMNYLQQAVAYSIGFDHVPVGNDNSFSGGKNCMVDESGNEVCYEYQEPSVMIKANLNDKMIETYEGVYTVTQGRFFNDNDVEENAHVCLITEELAELNGLSIGDSISFTTMQSDSPEIMKMKEMDIDTSALVFEGEIIGIYNNKNEVDPNASNFNYMSPYENPKNIILMPLSAYADWYYTAQTEVQKYYSVIYGFDNAEIDMDSFYDVSKATYLLSDPMDVDSFVEDHQDKLKQYMKLSTDNETFEKLARPLDTLSFFANIIVWIVTLNAIVIISLVTALTLKTRESEIGVLLSIGVTKTIVIMQLFMELALVAFLGFSCAAVSGSLAAGWVGNKVLEFQQSSEFGSIEENNDDYYYSNPWDNNYYSDISQADLLAQYHVEVSPVIIAEIYVIGLFVVFISIMIPSVMIMRLNPKQILLSTN